MSGEKIFTYNNKQKRTLKDKVLYALKISFTFLVLYYLINKIESTTLIDSFREANYILIACAVLLGILNIYLQFTKWKIICSNSLDEYEAKKIWYSLFYGFAGAVITPFRIGEYAGRSFGFGNNNFVKISVGTLTDHFFSLIVILLAGSGGVLIYLKSFGYIDNSVFLLLIFTLSILAVLAKWLIMNGALLKLKAICQLKKIRFLTKFLKQADSFTGLNINLRFRLLLLSLLAFICYTMEYSILVAALSNQWSLHLYLLAGILTIFIKTIIPPFTLGELGIREGASIFFITQFGLPAAIGFNASILLFFLNIAVPAMIGGILLIKRN